MSDKSLQSADDVFAALGGLPGVMDLTKSKYKTVHQWKASGSFPSNTYVLMTTEIGRLGYTAPASLWDMREAVE